jgi:hypothetical protein
MLSITPDMVKHLLFEGGIPKLQVHSPERTPKGMRPSRGQKDTLRILFNALNVAPREEPGPPGTLDIDPAIIHANARRSPEIPEENRHQEEGEREKQNTPNLGGHARQKQHEHAHPHSHKRT